MKKRLLALALCLVLATSLLPVTALATEHDEMLKWIDGVEDGKTYCGDTYFSFICTEGHSVYNVGYRDSDYNFSPIKPDDSGSYKLDAGLGKIDLRFSADIHGEMLNVGIFITVNADHTDDNRDHICDVCNTYTECVDEAPTDCRCDICGASMHRWQYTTTENSLTVSCRKCGIASASVTLTAHSVTLPESPFNAQLKFEGDFKELFYCSDIEYRYEDPTTGWEYVDPDTFTPKPGNYQAGVLIAGLPGNGGVATRAVGNDDGTNQGGSVYLFVKYTAVDPAVTAQTGDNRPIEIMMASVLVFSALAAAAFILDSKRKYSR